MRLKLKNRKKKWQLAAISKTQQIVVNCNKKMHAQKGKKHKKKYHYVIYEPIDLQTIGRKVVKDKYR